MRQPATFKVYSASAGSGKTFTLVKEYLKIVLSNTNTEYFKHILAVTFTNKAANEMKQRVITSLKDFSETAYDSPSPMFIQVQQELNIPLNILKKRAKGILFSILDNYSAFNITTIDSFTHRLIRTFAFDLGLTRNFEVEMDAQSLLSEAVDALMAKMGEDEDLSKILVEFSLQKANEDKSWDITRELREIAQLLLNDNDTAQLEKIRNKALHDFINLKTNLFKRQRTIE
ncbi:MAG: UvrD-helicase domain-containing protein, partial [Flavobacteriaceae bacterium]|nr:UvrD-helicase domain-containing protein [Flavobacteriaceae bacterium]